MERFADDAAAAGVKLHPRHWRPPGAADLHLHVEAACAVLGSSRARAAHSRLIAAADAHATPVTNVDADHAFNEAVSFVLVGASGTAAGLLAGDWDCVDVVLDWLGVGFGSVTTRSGPVATSTPATIPSTADAPSATIPCVRLCISPR